MQKALLYLDSFVHEYTKKILKYQTNEHLYINLNNFY